VGDGITEHQAVDMFGPLDIPEDAAEIVHQQTDCRSFVIGQVSPTSHVSLRLDHQIPEVHVGHIGRKNVTDVGETVLEDDSTDNLVTTRVLLAYETVGNRQFCPLQPIESWWQTGKYSPP
jgi:hypothetical protein